jgi:hypothetical protein
MVGGNYIMNNFIIYVNLLHSVLKMVCTTRECCVCKFCPSSGILKNTAFRNLDLVSS